MIPEFRALEAITIRDVEEFLFYEAELVDGHRYDEWFALWTPDLLYWVPCNADDIDPQHHVSIIYDNYARLEERLFRLKTKHAHAQNPKSRLSRTVANIRLHNFDPIKGGEVSSRFIVVESRFDRLTIWAGRQHHILERHDGKWMIREKRVYLVNNDSRLGNMTFVI